ncbi:MAG: NAD-dependent epimerase/dehydratase family protein [bacterium]|nr:NAD-dependent epimerase/dehydratase family protein [bacterium]
MDHPTQVNTNTKKNWTYWSARKIVILKIIYDTAAASSALVLAFLTRYSLLYLTNPVESVRPDLSSIYLKFFVTHLGLFVAIALATFYSLGFYRLKNPSTSSWKPLKVLGGVALAPAIWALVTFFMQMPSPILFPRGITALTFGYFVLFAGFPRLFKFFVMSRMVVEIHHHRRNDIQKVLVIGGAGYIGSQLCRDLIAKGYRVRILDTFMFGRESIKDIENNPLIDIIEGDFRNIESVVKAMSRIDAVIHLGGIVGDPACSVDDDLTIDINLTATKMLAEICKSFKVERFIFASSCSVYGASANDELLNEESPLNPVSLYAKTKIASERVLMEMVAPDFTPVILRFATLFGLSPRPRFDLFINLATAKAVRDHKFTVFGGSQYRPFVHVKDISKALVAVLAAPAEIVKGQIINIGNEANSLTIGEAGNLVAEIVPGTSVELNTKVEDSRHYRVSFEKLRRLLGLSLDVSVQQGIAEMATALESGSLKGFDTNSALFSNLKQMEKIVSDEFLDSEQSTVLKLVPTSNRILSKIVNEG